MIIETPYKATDTVTIRTTAGEEIVARFVEEDATSIKVTKPLALQASQQGIGLGPWVFTVDPTSNIKINKNETNREALGVYKKRCCRCRRMYERVCSGVEKVCIQKTNTSQPRQSESDVKLLKHSSLTSTMCAAKTWIKNISTLD